jgi:cellulose synthase/poly-beta-1,6-N-acetylglucosamine synthase-like glycosyltransferase
VSVVLSVFEGADVLDETLASVAAQTLGDFECIVVDDGSTDPRVAAQLADWARRWPPPASIQPRAWRTPWAAMYGSMIIKYRSAR